MSEPNPEAEKVLEKYTSIADVTDILQAATFFFRFVEQHGADINLNHGGEEDLIRLAGIDPDRPYVLRMNGEITLDYREYGTIMRWAQSRTAFDG